MKVKKILINTSDGRYPILIGKNLSFSLGNHLKKNKIFSSKFLLVIDNKVPGGLINKIKKSLKKKNLFNFFKIHTKK